MPISLPRLAANSKDLQSQDTRMKKPPVRREGGMVAVIKLGFAAATGSDEQANDTEAAEDERRRLRYAKGDRSSARHI